MASVQQIVISSLIFITIIAGGILTFTDVNNVYKGQDYYDGDFANTAFANSSNVNKINETYDLSRQITEKFDEASTDQSNLDTWVVGGITSLKTTLNVFDITKAVISFVAKDVLGIPTWLFNSILAGIIFTITLAIISAVVGRRTD